METQNRAASARPGLVELSGLIVEQYGKTGLSQQQQDHQNEQTAGLSAALQTNGWQWPKNGATRTCQSGSCVQPCQRYSLCRIACSRATCTRSQEESRIFARSHERARRELPDLRQMFGGTGDLGVVGGERIGNPGIHRIDRK